MSRLILVGLTQSPEAVARVLSDISPDQVYMPMSGEAREFLSQLERAFNVRDLNNHRLGSFQEPGSGRTEDGVFKGVRAYYTQSMVRELQYERDSLVIGGETALRAMIRCIESVGSQQAAKLRLTPSQVRVYRLSGHGRLMDRDVRTIA